MEGRAALGVDIAENANVDDCISADVAACGVENLEKGTALARQIAGKVQSHIRASRDLAGIAGKDFVKVANGRNACRRQVDRGVRANRPAIVKDAEVPFSLCGEIAGEIEAEVGAADYSTTGVVDPGIEIAAD